MNKNLKLTILIVEDEKTIATVIAYNLQKEGYAVHIISDGAEAAMWAKNSPPDLILLDWVLPSKTGVEVCNELRQDPKTSNVPIIMISAKSQDFDKVEGLSYGADDYITKPFSPIELIARVKAVLRRIRPAFAEKSLKFHDIIMDLNTYNVSRNGKDVKLAPIEFQILQIMMEQPEIVLSRQALIEKIWGIDIDVDQRTVDVHITRLRKALMSASVDDVDIIKTVRLVGYKLQLPRKARAHYME
ncbi:MAG: Phosphate regulon transcriptional regulatory protein PhoB [Candidatus Midichloria mitochondrii]|uniref:Phosphate regulon transcriptional regulatory protein PhoB n=1 Tax=Midichloria mitochondrii (strain IricVA) TaxID=696127 RepID=F7XWS3_MIDMI|nr:response regulator [Candidatus Midichloria mitochondrii]AEI89122.1 phosphate regulon transcriptional regulatory protein PhoB [Candidatus Midichloria mitochondrii IricVA]MDJ1583530.1 response regulator [Candidatus Midichloria mitochondrii]